MVRHTNITVACVYNEDDESLLTNSFHASRRTAAESEIDTEEIDFSFMDDDDDDDDDDDYDSDANTVPVLGTRSRSHEDRHIRM